MKVREYDVDVRSKSFEQLKKMLGLRVTRAKGSYVKRYNIYCVNEGSVTIGLKQAALHEKRYIAFTDTDLSYAEFSDILLKIIRHRELEALESDSELLTRCIRNGGFLNYVRKLENITLKLDDV